MKRTETEHPSGVVICGDCNNPLHDPGYHMWGERDANGKRAKVCIDEPVMRNATTGEPR